LRALIDCKNINITADRAGGRILRQFDKRIIG
jgi:hypothetical protein